MSIDPLVTEVVPCTEKVALCDCVDFSMRSRATHVDPGLLTRRNELAAAVIVKIGATNPHRDPGNPALWVWETITRDGKHERSHQVLMVDAASMTERFVAEHPRWPCKHILAVVRAALQARAHEEVLEFRVSATVEQIVAYCHVLQERYGEYVERRACLINGAYVLAVPKGCLTPEDSADPPVFTEPIHDFGDGILFPLETKGTSTIPQAKIRADAARIAMLTGDLSHEPLFKR